MKWRLRLLEIVQSITIDYNYRLRFSHAWSIYIPQCPICIFSFLRNNLTLNLPEIKRSILVYDYIIPNSTSHLHISHNIPSIYTSQYPLYIYCTIFHLQFTIYIYLTISHLYKHHNFPYVWLNLGNIVTRKKVTENI